MRRRNELLQGVTVSSELLDAKSFLDLANAHPEQVKRVAIVPGKLGSKSFSKFLVEYAAPHIKVFTK